MLIFAFATFFPKEKPELYTWEILPKISKNIEIGKISKKH
jgi:hypothetical protein